MNELLIYGASGHSKVICSIAESNCLNILGIFDDYKKCLNNTYVFLKKYNPSVFTESPLIIAIGDNIIRKEISRLVSHKFIQLSDKSSCIDKSVIIEIGTVVLHRAIVQRDSIIGKHCIINTNATIDHECNLGDFIHISPGAVLCGNVKVGEGTHIGAGATVIPNIKIGKWCIIGAGAVITKDIPDYSLVVGVPGKIIKKLKND